MRQISESALEENIVRKILDKCGPLDLKGKNCCRVHKMFVLCTGNPDKFHLDFLKFP